MISSPCRITRNTLLSASFLTTVALLSPAALRSAYAGGALPSGGHYVAGQGSIAGGRTGTTVNQASTTGIVDWNSFAIGRSNSVTFDNGSGATLNRVTGGNISLIAGSLKATGSLYLMNTQGVIIDRSGHVLTGGSFVAATSTSGLMNRTAAVGNIRNAGTINAATVGLLGRDVTNTGTIVVNRGGQIWLTSSNATSISGSLSADNATGAAGTIVATGRAVFVGAHAKVSANGLTGGTILIGGDIHGGAIAADNFANRHLRMPGRRALQPARRFRPQVHRCAAAMW